MDTEKDIEFLKEMKNHLENGRLDMVNGMIDDWLTELQDKVDFDNVIDDFHLEFYDE